MNKKSSRKIEFYKKQLTENVIIGLISFLMIFILPWIFKWIFIILFIVCAVKGQMLKYKLDKLKAKIK